MNNIELNLKVKEILAHDNFFDMVMAVQAFEPEYKTSEFYKATKLPLMKIMPQIKMFYFANWKEITAEAQKGLNNLNFDNVQTVLGQFGDMMDKENAAILDERDFLEGIVAGLK